MLMKEIIGRSGLMANQDVGESASLLAKIANAEPATNTTPNISCGTFNFSLKTKYEMTTTINGWASWTSDGVVAPSRRSDM